MPSQAGTSKVVDLCSNAVPFLLELKWIGRSGMRNRKIREIYEDIQTTQSIPPVERSFSSSLIPSETSKTHGNLNRN